MSEVLAELRFLGCLFILVIIIGAICVLATWLTGQPLYPIGDVIGISKIFTGI